MSNLLTIVRRELRAYFESAIGYIFVIVFLMVSVGLFISPFFTFPRAEMRHFFSLLPLILCVFVPAITMRLWAEDRKENTWEMLLTFPMKPWELVGGKFGAALIFFCIAVAGTLTIPIMLAVLGDPDPGPIMGAYFGTFLLGAFFLSMGLFFSALFSDQIVAFVITLLACFGVFLLGTDFMTTIIDGVLPGLGSVLAELVGMTGHFNAFGKGVIELGDLLYFLVWTAVFLFLNGVYLEGRNRPRYRTLFGTTTLICVAIGLAFNWVIAGQSLARFDLTEDRIYTVSSASKKILGRLKVPVQVKVYITPKGKMPTGLKSLELDVRDKLEEMKLASRGKLQFRVLHMEAANVIQSMREEAQGKGPEKSDKEKAIERRMLDKGVKPFSVQALEADQVTSKLIYSSIGVAYKDKPEEILPNIMPQTLDQLEYRLINTIYKLTRDKKPKVALVAPMEDVKVDPRMAQILRQLGRPVPTSEDPYVYLQRILELEKYEVIRAKLERRSPMPADYDTLVVVNPRALNERQQYEISRALYEGKSVFMAVQQQEWTYKVERQAVNISRREVKPKVNAILKSIGVEVDPDILMDSNHQPLTLSDPSNPLARLMGGGLTLNLPTHIQVSGSTMNKKVSITSQLPGLFYLWGSAIKVDDDKLKENKIEKTVLVSSSADAWTMTPTMTLDQDSFKPPSAGMKSYPLAVMLQGQFPFAYAKKKRPAWPKEPPQNPRNRFQRPPPPEGPETTPRKKPGKLVLVGCSQLFRKSFLAAGNLDFFLNSIDALTLGDDLVNVRGKKRIDRAISRPSDGVRAFWKFVNLGLVNLLVAVVGIVGAILRRQSREAYLIRQQVS